jgi:hypothetical protein
MGVTASSASVKLTGYNHFTESSIGVELISIQHGSVKLVLRFILVMEGNPARTVTF